MFLVLLALLGCRPPPPPATAFVVRHAEKAGDKGDVPLTAAGQKRARTLARVLADVPLVGVHSTDYARTRQTALPTAASHKLDLQLYDPKQPESLIAMLKASTGPHLVVGHSNTAPALVAALGGDPGKPIEEAEFDRLYVVTLPHSGPPTSALLRYGN